MGLEQGGAGRGAHLTGDDALEILLYGQDIDRLDAVAHGQQAERAAESLRLLTLPMKMHADGDILKRKAILLTRRDKRQLLKATALPKDGTGGDTERETGGGIRGRSERKNGSVGLPALCRITAVKRKRDFLTADDAHGDRRFG